MHLVTRRPNHFRSRDKDGGPTYISSIIAKNRMLYANFMALCFIEPELLLMEVLHNGNRDLGPFCSCDLDSHPMTFIYELAVSTGSTKMNLL